MGNSFHWTNKQLNKALLTQWHYHCPYCLQSPGKVEQTNGNLKLKLAKLTESTGLPWTKILPLVLMAIRSTPVEKHKLIPYERVIRRPMSLMTESRMSPALNMTRYFKTLMHYIKVAFHQVKEAFCESPTDGQTFHNLESGEVFW